MTLADPAQEVNGGSGLGSRGQPWSTGVPSGADRPYVVEVSFLGGSHGHRRGPRTVRLEVVPADLGGYQLLEVTSCDRVAER